MAEFDTSAVRTLLAEARVKASENSCDGLISYDAYTSVVGAAEMLLQVIDHLQKDTARLREGLAEALRMVSAHPGRGSAKTSPVYAAMEDWSQAIAETRAMQQADYRGKYVTVDGSGVYKCVGQNFYTREVTLETPFGRVEISVGRVEITGGAA